ncbi:MAG TPA: Clp protease N-terminal domain-containing protein [Trebonia sp.]|jgi:hypothetical protein|nr:Clp protease N-terminal domain-containing protein [Trebonia sp.]
MAKRGIRPVLERLAPGVRAIQWGAFDHAIRLGHASIGSEHVLLALAGADHPAAAVLRAHGVTPERVEEQVTRRAGGGMFTDLDRTALAAVGIDVDAVCARMTESFGPEALSRAGRASVRDHRSAWWNPRRQYVGPGAQRNGVFLPSRPGVIQCLHHAHVAEQSRHDSQISVGHFALGILSVTDGLAPVILAELSDVPLSALRSALMDTR